MSTLYAGLPCVDPKTIDVACRDQPHSIPTQQWINKAGLFRLPTGKSWGIGHILLTLESLDAINKDVDNSLTFSGEDNRHQVTLSHITLIRTTCVTPGHADDPLATYLCELVDRRYHLARIPLPEGYIAYNLRNPAGTDYLAATVNAGVAWEWQEIVDDLVTILNESTDEFTLPFVPDATPENLTFDRMGAWETLNRLLSRIACVAVYNPVNDEFSVVRLGEDEDTALTALKANNLYKGRTWDGYETETDRGRLPQKVKVRFLRRPQPSGPDLGASPYYTVDVTLAATVGVVAGTYVELDDDATAEGATGTPTNSIELAVRAQERADDWRRKRVGYERRLLRVYRDFQPTALSLLGSAVSTILFDDSGLRYPDGAMQTSAMSEPDELLEGFTPMSNNWPPWWPFNPANIPPSGGGSGSGSGSGGGQDGCSAAINPVSVECEEGERVLRSVVFAIGLNDAGELVPSQCETLDYPLGPCSPRNPAGTRMAVTVNVCPIYATCLSLDTSHELLPEDWLVDVEGGNTITLPSSVIAGEGCWFVVTNTGGGTVTIEAQAGETINGEASIELTDDFSSAQIFLSCSEATDWTAAILSGTGGGSGTVTSITLTTANGMQVSAGTTQTITTSGTFALTLPFTLAGSGTVTNSGTTALTAFTGSGTSSGTNTGNQTTSGTSNRISVATGSANPVIDIDAAYVGQSSITTLGTVTTGTWNATILSPTYGGTGVNNASRTLTVAANSGTISFTSSVTLTVAATASVSGTNTGDQNLFSTIAVSGQSDIVADSTTDTLTVAAGTGITLTTNATTDTLTITGTGGTVTSVTGTTNQVAVATGTTTPVISLAGPHNFTTLTIHGILLGQTTGAITATAAMTDGQLLVGQTSADPLPKTVSGSGATITMAATGVITISAIALTSLAAQAANTIVANATTGSAAPTAVAIAASRVVGRTASSDVEGMTGAETTALLSNFVVAGGSAAKGLAPAPGATAHPTNPYPLCDDGSYQSPSGKVLGTSQVLTSETTSSTTPVDLATVQQFTFVLDVTTTVIFSCSAGIQQNTATGSCRLWIYDGTTALQVTGFQCPNAGQTQTSGGEREVSLAAGTYTYNMRFDVNAGTGTFVRRYFKAVIK